MLLEYLALIGISAALMLLFGELSRKYWISAIGGMVIFFLGTWMLLDNIGIQYQVGQMITIDNSNSTDDTTNNFYIGFAPAKNTEFNQVEI